MRDGGQNGDFEQLVRPHFDRLYRLAWRLTGAQAEAEDLFQEVLTRAFTSLADLRKLDDPGSWLGRVMYNLFVDERRRYARRRLVVVEEHALGEEGIGAAAGSDSPERDSHLAQAAERLEAAIARLGEEHRIVILLHDADGYKMSEIQELTGTPIGTIKSRLHRARSRLKEILEENGTLAPP